MINLLPQYWQKKLDDEENVKTIAILGIILVVTLLLFAVMLYLAKVKYSGELKAGEIVIAEKKSQMEMLEVNAAEKSIVDYDSLVLEVDKFYKKKTRVTDVFLKVADALPSGVYLTSFNYSSGKIELRGFAPEREKLVAFKGNLEKEKDLSDVNFPSSNWLTAQNIDFMVILKYDQLGK